MQKFGTIRLSILLLAGLSSAYAQTLTVSPQQLSFNVPVGVQNSSAQVVTVTPDAAATNGQVAWSVAAGSPWLRVQGSSSGTQQSIPASGLPLSVTVNTQGLVTGQTYNGSFTVQIPSVAASLKTVNVNLIVGGNSNLSAAPTQLAFTALTGATVGTPTSQDVTIASTAGTLSFTLSVQTQNGGNWLSVSSTGGVVGSPSGTFSVSVIPTGLAAGTYNGTITAQSVSTGDLAQIPVTLTVTATPTVTVKPTAVQPFLFRVGGTVPAAQTISISTNGSNQAFTVTQNPPVQWLVINPLNGSVSSTSPAVVSLNVTPTGLPVGTQTTNVIITPTGGTALPPIPVSLVVTNNPILEVPSTTQTFTGVFAGANPAPKVLNVTSVGGSTGFSVSTDAPWLQAATSGSTTPAQITVSVNTAGLAVGSYDGTITVKPTNGDNYALTVPVSLTVSNPVRLTAAPSTLLFSFQTSQTPPAAQGIQVRSTGEALAFTVATSTTTCGSSWLSATPSSGTTPSSIVTVSVATAGLSAGVCSGTVSLTYGQSIPPVQVPVTLVVSAGPVLSISQPLGFGSETVEQGPLGSNVITRAISLTSTSPTTQVDFSAVATTNGQIGWLSVGPGTGTTPQNLLVTVLPGGLAPGTYGGQVSIFAPSLPGDLPNKTFVLPVTLTVNPAVTVKVNPASLTFTQSQGGSLPPNQSLTLSSAGGTASYTATVTPITGGDWLAVSPASGSANRDITVSIKANTLPASATPYTAQISLAFQNSSTPPVIVPVSLTVTGPRAISATPQSLTFAAQGNIAPATQKISVASTGTSAVNFTVGTTATPSGWLTTDINSGTTPKDITVSVNPQGLAAATYNGSVTVTVGSDTLTVPVTLTVGATPTPQPTTITNNASGQAGSIAPGEMIAIKGTALGPSSPPNNGLFSINGQGGVDSTLFGVRVLFDGIPGTPIYVSATQLNVIVPWEIAGRTSTNVVVENSGVQAPATNVRVENVAPAIYTLNQTGQGQGAVLNQDGSVNGPTSATTRPATQNSIIAVYANGGGQTNPPGTTGSVSPTNQLLRITGPVTATIGGQNAVVEFVGAAPGLVTGVVQVNLRVPIGVTGNTLPVSFTVNGVASPGGVTVAVQ
jgi:trimeric autotransporter adhesin